MKKAETTDLLDAALQRILTNSPSVIEKARKLSLRAVEEEARLGNGSIYYYKDFVAKVKLLIEQSKSNDTEPVDQKSKLRMRIAKEARLKDKYRESKQQLEGKLSAMTARLHEAHSALYNAQLQIADLEYKLAAMKKRNVVDLKPV